MYSANYVTVLAWCLPSESVHVFLVSHTRATSPAIFYEKNAPFLECLTVKITPLPTFETSETACPTTQRHLTETSARMLQESQISHWRTQILDSLLIWFLPTSSYSVYFRTKYSHIFVLKHYQLFSYYRKSSKFHARTKEQVKSPVSIIWRIILPCTSHLQNRKKSVSLVFPFVPSSFFQKETTEGSALDSLNCNGLPIRLHYTHTPGSIPNCCTVVHGSEIQTS